MTLERMMNFREVIEWLDEHIYGDYYSIEKVFAKEYHTPLKYRGFYERIGYISVWNDVGCEEENIDMYRPVDGGTVLYDMTYTNN